MSVGTSRALVADPRLSNDSSVRGSPEYLEAFELETWKKQEENKFRLWLKEEEQKKRAELDKVAQEKEEARAIEFRTKMKLLHNIESKLRAKLVELESREQKISNAEADLRRDKKDTDLKVKRLIENHASTLKAANDAHNSALRVEAERLRLEALRRQEAEKELERRGKVREALPAELADLHAKLKISKYELEQALEREELMMQSRDHFRNALISSMQPHQPDCSEERLKRLRIQRQELISEGFAADDRVIVALDQQIYRILNN
jgi:hypothetical protein